MKVRVFVSVYQYLQSVGIGGVLSRRAGPELGDLDLLRHMQTVRYGDLK